MGLPLNPTKTIVVDQSGNTGIRYEIYGKSGLDQDGHREERIVWDVYLFPNMSFEEALDNKKDRLEQIRVHGEGDYPSEKKLADAICEVIEMTRSEKNQDLGIKVGSVSSSDGVDEILLLELKEKFGMTPTTVERNFSMPDIKS